MDISRIGSLPEKTVASHAPAPHTEKESLPRGDEVSIGERATPKELEVAKKKWTILQYSAADNNLESDMVQDIMDMEKVGSDKNTNLVVQLDRGKSPSDISGGWAGCRRYLLKKSDGSEIKSPVLQDMGQVNMADPKTLKDFITWGIKNYPAEHYILIISDHGDGWHGAISDDSSSDAWMSMDTLGKALKDAKKESGVEVDVLGFDACLMASTEVAYESRNTAKYLVASQESEGADGWPYTKILSEKVLKELQQALRQKIDITPEELVKKIVKKSGDDPEVTPTMSAVDLKKMDGLGKAANDMAEKILATETPARVLKDIAGDTQSFGGYRDFYDFCERITKSDAVKDKELKKSAGAVMTAISGAVIAEQHAPSHPDAHGLHVEIPSWGSTEAGYKKLEFAKSTKWDEAMDRLGASESPGNTQPNADWNISG